MEIEKAEAKPQSSYSDLGKMTMNEGFSATLDGPLSDTLYQHGGGYSKRVDERHELSGHRTPELPTWSGEVPAAELGTAF